ncbi:MAG: glycosyltransferase family 4 protein, partial [Chloroflexota bacterium]|nr:glycosyltransferase family 4 protein [Chloroflexota bacterium]
PEADRRPPVCVYTSDPSRGLRILLEVWPEIRRQVPEAQLKVFSSMRLYLRGAKEKPQHEALYDLARRLPGVEYVGSVPQPQLAKALRGARLLLYPNIFPETSCIAALEAQAAGCVVVTSNLGALPETAWGNPLVFAPPDSPAYRAAFVAQAVHVLTNDALWRSVSGQNRHRMQSYGWHAVAREWLSLMSRGLEP